MEHCQAAELSHRQVKVLQGEQKVDMVKGKVNEKSRKSLVTNTRNNEVNRDAYNCKKCGKKHTRQNCPAFGKSCNKCNKPNHFAIGCFSSGNKSQKNKTGKTTRHANEMAIVEESATEDTKQETFMLSVIKNNDQQCWCETLLINNVNVKCKLDTGADINVMPVSVYNSVKNNESQLKCKTVKIVTYGGNMLKPLGIVNLQCKLKGALSVNIEFAVVNVAEITILGLATCKKLNLVQRVNVLSKNEFLDIKSLVEGNKDIFEGVGCFPTKQKIIIKKGTVPVVKPPYRIAESLRLKLKKTLEIYEENQFIIKVNEPTDWVHNLVLVEKANGKLRLCLDPKELNKAIKREHYPIPTGDELTPSLANKKWYTVLDMKDGFFQLMLDEPSSKLCVFHTPFGRYRFLRMPFGLASAPEIFQKAISQQFGDIEGVLVYFDDLIISAKTLSEHDNILLKVIERARKCNIKFNPEKIQFRVDRVKYIGQVFSEKGINPDPAHVEAILKLKSPNNKKELQSMLGMVTYLGKFIPNLSQVTMPLRELLKKNVDWWWDEIHSSAVAKLKELIARSPVLKCFDASRPLTIQTDSSKDGLGCCLLMGRDPISFASRSLTSSEKNYAQIEKELLAIRFATLKFHTFIYGREVIVQTDHKPLVAIVLKDMGKISTRLQRMCLGLLRYNLKITYLPGKYMYVADLLSRNFPITQVPEDGDMLEKVHSIDIVLPISSEKLIQLQLETKKDPVLRVIKEYCETGWPNKLAKVDHKAKWAWKLKNQLRIKQEIIVLENKVVIPQTLIKEMLEILHLGHLGIIKCKKKARQLLFWKGMSRDIEKMISHCKVCEKYQNSNVKEPIIQYKIPDFPFEVVGSDICSDAGKDYLVTVCHLTRWLEIQELKGKTAEEVIKNLKVIFATHGIPKVIVSDNMPFASFEFRKFTKEWGIQQSLASPHYPKSNGLAERMVGVAKKLIKKARDSGGDLQLSLLDYRSCPLDGMEVSPAQLLMNRRLRTLLPVSSEALKPQLANNAREKIYKNKLRQQKYYNQHANERTPLKVGDSILIRKEKIWEPGIVKQICKEPRSYIVMDKGGHSYRRNKQHLRVSRNEPPVINSNSHEVTEQFREFPEKVGTPPQVNTDGLADPSNEYRTRSGRLITKPGRYADFVKL